MTPEQQQQWMQQWRFAARELPKIRERELRELTDEDVWRLSGLLSESNVTDAGGTSHTETPVPAEPEIPEQHGMVIQQRWFTRFRVLQLQQQLAQLQHDAPDNGTQL